MPRHQIEIAEPCQENWHAMTTNEKGRFCDRCQHAVVDFTRMSDRQVVEYMRKAAGGKVCGHIEARRLAEGLVVESKGWKAFWQSAAAGLGLAMLFGNSASAQDGQSAFLSQTFISWMKPEQHLEYRYENLVTLEHAPAILPTYTIEAEPPKVLIDGQITGTTIVESRRPDRWMLNRIRDFLKGEGN